MDDPPVVSNIERRAMAVIVGASALVSSPVYACLSAAVWTVDILRAPSAPCLVARRAPCRHWFGSVHCVADDALLDLSAAVTLVDIGADLSPARAEARVEAISLLHRLATWQDGERTWLALGAWATWAKEFP